MFTNELRALLGARTNLLLLCLPIALVLEWMHAPATWIFATSALAVIPLAGVIGNSTERIAERLGPGVGGFLNATFGNGAELLIGAFALHRGLVDVVKASLSGSIIGNLLLVLGLATLVGGWGRQRQRFSRVGAGAQVLMLFLAVVAMVMPAVFDLTVLGSLTATSPALDALSLLSAGVMLVAYASGLIFSLWTHSDVFRSSPAPDDQATANSSEPADQAGADSSEPDDPAGGSLTPAIVTLAGATALTALAAEILVGSIETTAHTIGLNDLFVGMIVIAIVGNAAEHFSAVLVARDGNMQLAINIAKESSIQIALFVAPVLVLLSWLFGAPMTLVFHPFELFGIALAVGAVALVSMDGETNWFEGALLLAVYALLAIAVYFVPLATAGPASP